MRRVGFFPYPDLEVHGFRGSIDYREVISGV